MLPGTESDLTLVRLQLVCRAYLSLFTRQGNRLDGALFDSVSRREPPECRGKSTYVATGSGAVGILVHETMLVTCRCVLTVWFLTM